MTITDDLITSYLEVVFGRSSPGDALHHLLVAAAKPGRSPLGLVDADKLEVYMYAIAPDRTVEDVDQFIAKVFMSAAIEAHQGGRAIHFAALAIEGYVPLIAEDDEAAENLARRLKAEDKLNEHPSAVEATRLYAACSDGRRWSGQHILTGPAAGTIIGPDLRVGGLADDERGSLFHRLVRKLVMGGHR